MMWVRFPNGQVVQYNDAKQLYHDNESWDLYTAKKEKGGKWICSIQFTSGAIVEAIEACSAHNSLSNFNPDSLSELQREVKLLKRSVDRLIKNKKA